MVYKNKAERHYDEESKKYYFTKETTITGIKVKYKITDERYPEILEFSFYDISTSPVKADDIESVITFFQNLKKFRDIQRNLRKAHSKEVIDERKVFLEILALDSL
jgi:hypothetical protein